MTLPIFPSNLPGLAFDVLRQQQWSSRIMTATSGKEYRAATQSFPRYVYSVSYSVLRSSAAFLELQTLFGFCNAAQGQFAPFLYTDPSDNSATLQQIGVGDGTTRSFSFVRAFGGFVEPVLAVNAISQVTVAGTPTSAYTTSQTGAYGTDTITFTSAPANLAAIKASFSFYWPCRFMQDDPEFNNFAAQFWGLKRLQFITLK
jgi:uncharacterized protein (TIGR02217 family)